MKKLSRGLPIVSVVTPSLNQAPFLEECLLSVLKQEYPALEYLVIDGGSTDGSVEIIKRHAGRLAYWISEADKGQSDAINKGWRQSTGEILAWVNADDTYLPGAISRAVEFLVQHPDIDVVYGECDWVNAQGVPGIYNRPFAIPFDRVALMFTDYIPSGSTFIRRRVFEITGEMDTALRFFMDWDYWLRACNGNNFHFLPSVLSRFRIHEAARTWSNDALKAQEMWHWAQKIKNLSLPHDMARARQQAVSKLCLAAADNAFVAGMSKDSRRYLWASFAEARLRYDRHHLRTAVRVLFGENIERSIRKSFWFIKS